MPPVLSSGRMRPGSPRAIQENFKNEQDRGQLAKDVRSSLSSCGQTERAGLKARFLLGNTYPDTLGGCRTEVRCEVQGIGFIGKHGEIVGEWLGELSSAADSLTALLWSPKGDRALGAVKCSKAVFSNPTGTASTDCAWHKSVSTRYAHSLSRGS